MDDRLLLSDNTDDDDDDDRAQGDGSSSSAIVSDDDQTSLPLTNSLTSFLSTEDLDKCVYVSNINWKRKYSVSISI